MNKIKNILLSEYDAYPAWLAVSCMLGVICYFALNFEPDYRISLGLLLLSSILCAKYHNLTIIVFFILGFSSINLKTTIVKAPILKADIGKTQVTGAVEAIIYAQRGKKIILRDPLIQRSKLKLTKIRININKKKLNFNIGDRIKLSAFVKAIPPPIIEGGYNFARRAYFRQIGAVGYALSTPEVIATPQTFSFGGFVQNIRLTIMDKVSEHLSRIHASIANSLLVGERSSVPKKIIENIRDSGLAHLLAISGMHLALATSIFFITSRKLMSYSETLTLHFNIKKIAAYSAVIGGLLYLFISGMPVSAIRAFIMAGLILLAIILDRVNTPIRSIAIAAVIIIIWQGESVIEPGFQMSFIAVLALVSCYQLATPYLNEITDYTLLRKFWLYLFSIIISSSVASLATAPIAIYHFNKIASYGILSNLLAVPLTSFFIMPLGIISLIAMSIGLEKYPLQAMSLGIETLVNIANEVSSWGNSTQIFAIAPTISLLLIVGGMLWLFIWQTSWRLWGIAPIILGCLLYYFYDNKPDIVATKSGIVAIKEPNSYQLIQLYKVNDFALETVAHKLAAKQENLTKCTMAWCRYHINNHSLVIVNSSSSLEQSCQYNDIIINLTGTQSDNCQDKIHITPSNLYQHQAYSIKLGRQIKVKTLQQSLGKRPWVL